jgi:hypothetical protein
MQLCGMDKEQERRRYPRIPVSGDHPVHCTIRAVDPQAGDSEVRDASRTGFSLVSDTPFDKGTDLRLNIRYGDTELRDIRAFVVHARAESENCWHLGVALNFRQGDMRSADTYNGLTLLLEQLQGD